MSILLILPTRAGVALILALLAVQPAAGRQGDEQGKFAALAAGTTACTGFACRAAAREPEVNRWREFAGDILGPGALIGNVAGAGVNHLLDQPERWNGRWDGYGRRLASQAGEVAISESVEHSLAAILDRPTRYRPCTRCGSTGQRIGYAFQAALFDITADGGTAIAVPRILGSYAGAFAQAAWTPGWGRGDALLTGTISIVAAALPNLAQEIFGIGRD